MASTITRKSFLVGGTITVEFRVVAKDAGDDALIQKYGDVSIDVTGYFSDPGDPTYPKFYVNAGDPVMLFAAEKVIGQFEDDTMTSASLQKRADLWGDNIQTQIQNGILALRALTDVITGTTSITI